jgi:hypothetical protein
MMAKEIIIGFLIGLLANLAGMYLYITIFFGDNLEKTINTAIQQGIMGSLIALGAILNFLPFFVFMKKRQYYRVRGVVIATLLAAVAVVFFEF